MFVARGRMHSFNWQHLPFHHLHLSNYFYPSSLSYVPHGRSSIKKINHEGAVIRLPVQNVSEAKAKVTKKHYSQSRCVVLQVKKKIRFIRSNHKDQDMNLYASDYDETYLYFHD